MRALTRNFFAIRIPVTLDAVVGSVIAMVTLGLIFAYLFVLML